MTEKTMADADKDLDEFIVKAKEEGVEGQMVLVASLAASMALNYHNLFSRLISDHTDMPPIKRMYDALDDGAKEVAAQAAPIALGMALTSLFVDIAVKHDGVSGGIHAIEGAEHAFTLAKSIKEHVEKSISILANKDDNGEAVQSHDVGDADLYVARKEKPH